MRGGGRQPENGRALELNKTYLPRPGVLETVETDAADSVLIDNATPARSCCGLRRYVVPARNAAAKRSGQAVRKLRED